MKKLYTIIAFTLLGLNSNAQCGGNPIPVANFNFTDSCLNNPMDFIDSSTVSSGSIASWSWDFGDGNLNTFQNPSNAYIYPGTYSVILIVTTNNGCKDTVVKTVVVNPLPTAQFSASNVCDGNVVSFNDLSTISSGNIQSFQWDFGDGSILANNQNISHVYSSAGSYNVKLLVVSSFGCSDSITKTSIVSPNPLVNFTASPVMGCEPLCVSFMDSSFIATGAIVQWLWNFGDGSPASYSQNPYNCYGSGFYDVSLTITSDNGCAATLTKTQCIEAIICSEYIWPGDADNNAIANNDDLLPIGLYYGETGITRSSISNVWQADSVADWGITQNNGIDIKHLDCNGDGTIDANDTLAINLNFNLTHGIPVINNTSGERAASDLYFITAGTSFNPGDWVNAELWLGSSTSPISNLYGVAFNIHYDVSLVQPGTENLSYSSSWLGTPGADVLKIAKVDALSYTAYGALTRTDHTDVSGYGKIADFKFQIKTSLTSPVTMPLWISNYKANNASGAEQTFTTSVTEINKATGITVYPNPFSSQTNISFTEEQNHSIIKITDVLGKEVKIIDFSGKHVSIEKGEMKDGIYFLHVVNEKKNIVNEKIIIQ
ncbi:MAG: PKD domain-containing protein [Bacteroidota bacterium]